MRIERIDLDGFQGLSGNFGFPDDGLAVWAAPSGAGKTRLWRSVVAAFYGDENETSGWVLVRFTLDDGSSYALARDLAAERVEITDLRGTDVTAQFGPTPASIGQKLFRLTRREFVAASRISATELRETVGHPDLLSAIGFRPSRESTSLAGPPAGRRDVERPADVAPELDLEIFRSPGEQMGFVAAGPEAGTAVDPLDFVIETAGAEPPGAATAPGEGLPDPEEAGIIPAERQRRLQLALGALETRHTVKKRELVAHSERLHDLQAEADGLASLRDAEPRDIEALADLLRRIADIDEARGALAGRTADYRASLEGAGISVPALESETAVLRSLPKDDVAMLQSFGQVEAVRRGNQALIRSESRLDESRLAEIAAAQERMSRAALWPLAIACAGLFASIAMGFLAAPVPRMVPLALAFAAALAGGLMLWRGRRHRAGERARLMQEQARKQAQLQALEHEESELNQRLAALAARCGATDGPELLQRFDAWTARARERQELAKLKLRGVELQKKWVAAREELGRFAAANSGSDSTDANLLDADQIHRNYVRCFELREVLADSERVSSDLEDDLIALETERAELRQAIEDLVAETAPEAEPAAAAGSAPGLDGPGEASPAAAPAPEEAPRGIEMEWSPALSARTEAILRRILPEVRDVEIDGALSPQLRFNRRTHAFGELSSRLTGASIDQVCLALRLAIVETVGSSRERIPVFLDDPLTRADDARHDRALMFLVEDASVRGQVILLTAQEVRAKWFLHQHPEHRGRFGAILSDAPAGGTPSAEPSPVSSPSS